METQKMPLIIKIIFISLLTLAGQQTSDPMINIRGLRVDVGYLYNLYPDKTVTAIAEELVRKASRGGVNTLFIYAYNSAFGSTYVTDYPFTTVEGGYGRHDILNHISLEARRNGIKVVACVPANNFKTLWEQKPEWRAKTIDGADYVPAENMFLLSAWHPEFKSWLKGFFRDLIVKNPYIDGLEIVEPFIDYRWQRESDYNPFANARFKKQFPSGKLGDENWLLVRAQGLTELITIMNAAAHFYKKNSYLVHTWPANDDGLLVSYNFIRDHIGLDIAELLKLKGNKTLDYLSTELIWQQWAAQHGGDNFDPEWTAKTGLEFIKTLNSRTKAIIHVEITPFTGENGVVVKPTPEEFAATLKAITPLNVGIDVYDYGQIEYAGLWDALLSWF